VTPSPPDRGTPLAAGAAAGLGGALAAWRYHALGLTLSHYDARGHLVVARRIIDSITPGWQQIGAVWLPLPHLLNALPVQVDLFYRTGASGVAISIVSFAVAAAALAWIVLALTRSRAAAAAAALVFALNPNVVYLQATPMTEPLLLATTAAAVALLVAWCRAVDAHAGPERLRRRSRVVGSVFVLACLTRYEAWPVTVVALAAAAWTLWRRGVKPRAALTRVAGIGVYPAVAVLAFLVFSRVVIGEWFVASGFFVPENKALGDAALALKEVGWGVRELSGTWTIWIAAAGIAALVVAGAVSRDRADAWIALALGASAALPWSAFVRGHPFRIRYMVPLVAVEAVGAGYAAAIVRRPRAILVASCLVAGVALVELHPLDARAPMVVEAEWDRPNLPLRQKVTDCLTANRDGEKILASMGSLGHYMQSASASGFAVRDFLHEGNGDIWLAALESPRPYVGWILIEEKAEGGDMLADRARENPHWLDGFSRVCEGAGLALYRRDQNLKFSVKR
jgi:hypothetical protein